MDDGKRKTDKWIYSWLPRIIEVLVILAMIYGGMKVTIAGLNADVNKLKCDIENQKIESNTTKVEVGNIKTEMNVRFEYIAKTLDRIERKIK